MKKFLAMLSTGILSVICAFAFTACGGGKKDGETPEDETPAVTTVTEAEWKTALNALTDMKTSIKSNFITTYVGNSESGVFEYDAANNAVYFKSVINAAENAAEQGFEGYYWLENGNAYSYYIDYYDGEEQIEKSVKDTEYYEKLLPEMFSGYVGNYVIGGLELRDKYSKFEYSEENKEYAATIKVGEETDEKFECILKFENGKLVNFYYAFDEDEGKVRCTYEYTYGVTVTVPDDIKNMPAE